MSYNAQKHSVFSQRCRNIARNFQAMREELAALDAIYTNETASGSDVAFVDTAYAIEAGAHRHHPAGSGRGEFFW